MNTAPAPTSIEKRTESGWLLLTDSELDAAACTTFLASPEAGAIDVFIGTTRRVTRERETVHLAYECYAEMALREMEGLAAAARERWPVRHICLHHRLGTVPAGEASVIIGVSTPHRADAFEACRFLIDTLKERVPIWKYEVYADGAGEWVAPAGLEAQHP